MPTNTNEYDRTWYSQNKAAHKARITNRREEMRVWLSELKSTLSCPCGENDPACLDFHHRDPKVKDFAMANVVANGWGKKRVLAEIEKCDVLCANCHRKLHATLAQQARATLL